MSETEISLRLRRTAAVSLRRPNKSSLERTAQIKHPMVLRTSPDAAAAPLTASREIRRFIAMSRMFAVPFLRASPKHQRRNSQWFKMLPEWLPHEHTNIFHRPEQLWERINTGPSYLAGTLSQCVLL